jgi:hypothetical protein
MTGVARLRIVGELTILVLVRSVRDRGRDQPRARAHHQRHGPRRWSLTQLLLFQPDYSQA